MHSRQKRIAFLLLILMSISLGILFTCYYKYIYQHQFTPPAFSEHSCKIDSEPDKNFYGYQVIKTENFQVGICGQVILTESMNAQIYFTNVEENSVWLRLLILDMENNTVGDSGVIKPGERVKTVELVNDVNIGDEITLRILAYEPSTYYSEGSLNLKTQIYKK